MRLLGIALLAGCYNPTIAPGAPCTSSSECPGDQLCVGGTCGGTIEPIDAAIATDTAPQPDAFVPPPDAIPQQLVFGDNAGEVRDTEIWMTNATTNYGTANHFSIDLNESGLVWFDLTSVPAGKTVAVATLTVKVADQADEAGGTATIHRLREAWVETEATWTIRATNQAWSIAGARPPASDLAPVATFMPKAVQTVYDIALPPALVQSWVDDAAINFGVVFVRGTSTEHVHIHSREGGATPTLTLTVY